MMWDPELEELENKVRETFGLSGLAKAFARGLSRAPALNPERSKRPDLAEIMREHPGVSLVEGKEFADAMKCELRRMLTVH